jgi:hypothetical protein
VSQVAGVDHAKATGSPSLVRSAGPWIVFTGVLLVGASAALYLHHVDRYSLVLFGDATSHMVTARRVVDSADNPGLTQLGTNWLPLPHLLLLPFTLIDPLFTTGFAGVAVSLPCLAATSALVFMTIRTHMAAPAYLAAAGALLYALNPNILYVGLTAMTEAPFMVFFVGSAYFFQKWYSRPDDLRAMVLASLCTTAATMCRYEGWVLPPLLTAAAYWRLSRADLDTRRKVTGAVLALLSFVGIVVWVAYNAILYGDPLEFANAEYYSAAAQAQARDIRQTLFLQPANVAWVYGVTALTVYGPFLIAAAMAGYVLHRRGREGGVGGALLGWLTLPPLFTLALLLVGIGEMTLWFNSRFLILLSPLLIVLAVMFVQRVSTSAGRRRAWLAGALAACLAFSGWMISIDRVPTYLDARGGFQYQATPSATQTGEALASRYDGGMIMIMTGSAQAHRIMVTAGIPLARYDELLESSTWKGSYSAPWRYDRWLVISKMPDSDAVSTVGYWRERRDQLDGRYRTVYENEYHEILVLRTG